MSFLHSVFPPSKRFHYAGDDVSQTQNVNAHSSLHPSASEGIRRPSNSPNKTGLFAARALRLILHDIIAMHGECLETREMDVANTFLTLNADSQRILASLLQRTSLTHLVREMSDPATLRPSSDQTQQPSTADSRRVCVFIPPLPDGVRVSLTRSMALLAVDASDASYSKLRFDARMFWLCRDLAVRYSDKCTCPLLGPQPFELPPAASVPLRPPHRLALDSAMDIMSGLFPMQPRAATDHALCKLFPLTRCLGCPSLHSQCRGACGPSPCGGCDDVTRWCCSLAAAGLVEWLVPLPTANLASLSATFGARDVPLHEGVGSLGTCPAPSIESVDASPSLRFAKVIPPLYAATDGSASFAAYSADAVADGLPVLVDAPTLLRGLRVPELRALFSVTVAIMGACARFPAIGAAARGPLPARERAAVPHAAPAGPTGPPPIIRGNQHPDIFDVCSDSDSQSTPSKRASAVEDGPACVAVVPSDDDSSTSCIDLEDDSDMTDSDPSPPTAQPSAAAQPSAFDLLRSGAARAATAAAAALPTPAAVPKTKPALVLAVADALVPHTGPALREHRLLPRPSAASTRVCRDVMGAAVGAVVRLTVDGAALGMLMRLALVGREQSVDESHNLADAVHLMITSAGDLSGLRLPAIVPRPAFWPPSVGRRRNESLAPSAPPPPAALAADQSVEGTVRSCPHVPLVADDAPADAFRVFPSRACLRAFLAAMSVEDALQSALQSKATYATAVTVCLAIVVPALLAWSAAVHDQQAAARPRNSDGPCPHTRRPRDSVPLMHAVVHAALFAPKSRLARIMASLCAVPSRSTGGAPFVTAIATAVRTGDRTVSGSPTGCLSRSDGSDDGACALADIVSPLGDHHPEAAPQRPRGTHASTLDASRSVWSTPAISVAAMTDLPSAISEASVKALAAALSAAVVAAPPGDAEASPVSLSVRVPTSAAGWTHVLDAITPSSLSCDCLAIPGSAAGNHSTWRWCGCMSPTAPRSSTVLLDQSSRSAGVCGDTSCIHSLSFRYSAAHILCRAAADALPALEALGARRAAVAVAGALLTVPWYRPHRRGALHERICVAMRHIAGHSAQLVNAVVSFAEVSTAGEAPRAAGDGGLLSAPTRLLRDEDALSAELRAYKAVIACYRAANTATSTPRLSRQRDGAASPSNLVGRRRPAGRGARLAKAESLAAQQDRQMDDSDTAHTYGNAAAMYAAVVSCIPPLRYIPGFTYAVLPPCWVTTSGLRRLVSASRSSKQPFPSLMTGVIDPTPVGDAASCCAQLPCSGGTPHAGDDAFACCAVSAVPIVLGSSARHLWHGSLLYDNSDYAARTAAMPCGPPVGPEPCESDSEARHSVGLGARGWRAVRVTSAPLGSGPFLSATCTELYKTLPAPCLPRCASKEQKEQDPSSPRSRRPSASMHSSAPVLPVPASLLSGGLALALQYQGLCPFSAPHSDDTCGPPRTPPQRQRIFEIVVRGTRRRGGGPGSWDGGGWGPRGTLSVEAYALEVLHAAWGVDGSHDEGSILRAAMLLVIWPATFDGTVASGAPFPSPLATAPVDIGTPAFALRRHRALNAAISDFVKADDHVAHVVRIATAVNGVSCPGLRWGDAFLPPRGVLVADHIGQGLSGTSPAVPPAVTRASGLIDAVAAWLRSVSAAHAAALFRAALRTSASVSGFPDLTVWGPALSALGGAMYVEVKGPNDQLSDRQRCWLAHMAAAGIACCVCRVEDAVAHSRNDALM